MDYDCFKHLCNEIWWSSPWITVCVFYRYGVTPENIILYGQSIGTVPTIDLAARYECAAVILHSPLMSGLRVAFPDTRKTYCFDAFPRSVYDMHNGNESWARLCFNLISINVIKSSNNPPATPRSHIKSAILFHGSVNIIPKVFQGMLLCLKVCSIQKCWISSLKGIQEVSLLRRPQVTPLRVRLTCIR